MIIMEWKCNPASWTEKKRKRKNWIPIHNITYHVYGMLSSYYYDYSEFVLKQRIWHKSLVEFQSMINYGLECYVGRLASIWDDRITEISLMHNVADVGMLWNVPGKRTLGLTTVCFCFAAVAVSCASLVVVVVVVLSRVLGREVSKLFGFHLWHRIVFLLLLLWVSFFFPHLKIGSNLYSLWFQRYPLLTKWSPQGNERKPHLPWPWSKELSKAISWLALSKTHSSSKREEKRREKNRREKET